jgi:hypothetical protein
MSFMLTALMTAFDHNDTSGASEYDLSTNDLADA